MNFVFKSSEATEGRLSTKMRPSVENRAIEGSSQEFGKKFSPNAASMLLRYSWNDSELASDNEGRGGGEGICERISE